MLALLLAEGLSDAALAAGAYPPGQPGYDISWPQCGGDYPRLVSGDLAIVGVTGGRPFTPNPCLREEFAWGALTGRTPSLYVNIAFGLSTSGPQHCSVDNQRCRAYNYGFLAARYAYTYAYANSLGAAVGAPSWWLDVETANTWDDDTQLNSQVVLGALDFFRRLHPGRVGVYSTPRQWSIITGGLRASGVANWIPGARGPNDVIVCLNPLWPGAEVWLIQYLVGEFDQVSSC